MTVVMMRRVEWREGWRMRNNDIPARRKLVMLTESEERVHHFDIMLRRDDTNLKGVSIAMMVMALVSIQWSINYGVMDGHDVWIRQCVCMPSKCST